MKVLSRFPSRGPVGESVIREFVLLGTWKRTQQRPQSCGTTATQQRSHGGSASASCILPRPKVETDFSKQMLQVQVKICQEKKCAQASVKIESVAETKYLYFNNVQILRKQSICTLFPEANNFTTSQFMRRCNVIGRKSFHDPLRNSRSNRSDSRVSAPGHYFPSFEVLEYEDWRSQYQFTV